MFKSHPFLAVAIAAACAACGATFSTKDGSGSAAGADNAGEASGGLPGSAGSSSGGDAGAADSAGSSSAGQGSSAGAGGSPVGGAGAGSAGFGVGGWRSGSAGNWGGGDCAALRQEYSAAVEKARVCDKGSTDQCSASSVAEPVGCGCPVLVNAKSEATATAKKAYQALQDNHCDYGANCDIACLPVAGASCAQPPSMTSGNNFVCSAGIAL